MEQAKIQYLRKKNLVQQYNKAIQKMINFDDVTKKTIKEHNSN